MPCSNVLSSRHVFAFPTATCSSTRQEREVTRAVVWRRVLYSSWTGNLLVFIEIFASEGGAPGVAGKPHDSVAQRPRRKTVQQW